MLNDELQKDRLLKSDIESLLRQLTPYVPALGLLSGGIITSKHVYSHISKTASNAGVKDTSNDAGAEVEHTVKHEQQ